LSAAGRFENCLNRYQVGRVLAWRNSCKTTAVRQNVCFFTEPMHAFRRGVARYDGNRYKKKFSCLDQYLRMTFAQLTHRESLCDIEVYLRAQKDKLYQGVSGATFPEAPWPTRKNAEISVFMQISLRH